MLVVIDGSGNQQVSTFIRILQQGTPSIFSQSLSRGQDRQLRRTQLVNSVLGDRVEGQTVIVGQGADGLPLGFQLQLGDNRKLGCLGSNHRDGSCLWIPKMRAEDLGKSTIAPEHGCFGFFRTIGKNCSNWSFVTLCHVGVGIPEPLDSA